MDEEEIEGLLAEQRKELMAAKDLESDLDLAFRLQLQEAMDASIALQPSTSSSSPRAQPPLAVPHRSVFDFSDFDDLDPLELYRFEQERKGFRGFEAERRTVTNDLKHQVHDRKVAPGILGVPERGSMYYGDFVERPFGEGCSSSRISDKPYKLYFKGLVSDERVMGREMTVSAIGVAICDPRDNLVLKIQKPLSDEWKNHRLAELKALVEGLNAALSLEIKRINFYCVNMTIYKQITGRWSVKQRKIATLVNQIFLLQEKFEICRPLLVPGKDVKFAFKLARDAIESQITRSAEISSAKNSKETCTICLEDTDVSEMFAVDGCLHRYCFSCMKQHVEVKVLHGMVPGCPHEGCKIQLKLDSCRKFLSPKFVEMMSQRINEDAIPVTEKVYCPYPKCSILMSKSVVLDYANNFFNGADRSGVRKCIKCHGLFCIHCKVPWHSNMTCHEYKRSNPPAEEAKLKSLASQKLWRQCVKCNHMIELAEGCYHMTCRCGYEFCYTCGAEWKNKKATCSCPLWDEENIMHDYENEEIIMHEYEDEEDFYNEFDYDDSDEEYVLDFNNEFDEFNHRHFIF